MTKLAEFITDKLHQEVVAEKKRLIDAKQFNRLTHVKAKKVFTGAISSPQGMGFVFMFGALSAKYGKFGALRKIVLLQRMAQGLI
ncbi:MULTISPECIES: hypothetical protein [Pseudoalteromonas]|uniref:hypothetical protein n=1 Tax=Pseudoalteromonas TaxID=53246 RepID=UPI000FFF5AC3|nr:MULTISPECIES: hypothetical protein [Pseudoalteromonas]MCG9760978.1 hypothetical protein [Pseudoalteromonas sp. Isolate6]NKC19385.1 hypothetical protein [Pseudoalteromonas galatheae]RXE86699.1 hypothetical protein DRB05_10710 [Pseudoalteromonas sp. A757]